MALRVYGPDGLSPGCETLRIARRGDLVYKHLKKDTPQYRHQIRVRVLESRRNPELNALTYDEAEHCVISRYIDGPEATQQTCNDLRQHLVRTGRGHIGHASRRNVLVRESKPILIDPGVNTIALPFLVRWHPRPDELDPRLRLMATHPLGPPRRDWLEQHFPQVAQRYHEQLRQSRAEAHEALQSFAGPVAELSRRIDRATADPPGTSRFPQLRHDIGPGWALVSWGWVQLPPLAEILGVEVPSDLAELAGAEVERALRAARTAGWIVGQPAGGT